jgi:hypothetical protein
MTDNSGQPKMSHAEFLLKADAWLKTKMPIWKADFSNLNLLVEKPINDNELKLATLYLGFIYRSNVAKGGSWRVDAFFDEYKIAIARVIAGIGYRNYEKGNFWDGFWEALNLSDKFEGDRFGGKSKAEMQAEWGRSFLGVLEKFNLPTFPGYAQKYVVPILIHSGIPISCLPNYFLAIDRGLNEVGFNAEAIVQFLVGDDSNHSYGINKPVLRFLEAGGEFALEFVDRSIDALAKLARGESLDSHPLPEEVVLAAKAYFEQQDVWGEQTRKGKSLKAGKVEVRLSVAFGELNLLLPEIDTFENDFAWDLALDEIFKSETPRTIPGGHFTKRQAVKVAIEQPVRRLSIQASDGGVSREIGLYDSDFPAIFFSIDGDLIPRNVTLPKGIIYALMAKDKAKGFDIESDFVQQEISPLGWHNWELFRLDLSGLSNVLIFNGGPIKPVANKSRASITSEKLIEGLTFNGTTISVHRPRVKIPATLNSKWQIEIRDINDLNSKTIIEIDGEASEQLVDLFPDKSLPVFGSFEVAVRGPLGLGVSQKFAIIENLEVERPLGWRNLIDEGLSVHIAEFSTKDFDIFPKIAFLDSVTLVSSVKFTFAEKSLDCSYSPPAMSIATRTAGIPQPWQFGPVTVDAEDLESTDILIRVPSAYAEMQLSLVHDGQAVQGISNSLKQNKQMLSFALNNLAASIKLIKEGDLYFDFLGLKLRIGRIRPRQIAESVDATNYDIFLKGFTGGEVNLRIWSINEPWRSYVDVKVPDTGVVKIPNEFTGLGSLCVQWERIDPWSKSNLTELPDTSKLIFISLMSNPNSISTLGKQIESGQRAGREQFKKLSHCWTAILMALRIDNPVRMDIKSVLNASKLIGENPIHSLEVLSLQDLTQDEITKAISYSGILAAKIQNGSKSKLNDGEITSRFKRSNFAMLIPVLNSAMHPNSSKHLPTLWRQLVLSFGEELREISQNGELRNPQAGGFAKMEQILSQDPSNADHFVNLTGAYPREILHIDTRMIAGLNLFKKREYFQTSQTPITLEKALLDIQHEFTIKMPFANKYIATRTSTDATGWEVLSALSLAMAFLIRGSAHGVIQSEEKCAKYGYLTEAFSSFATELFVADLTMVELTILAQDLSRRPVFDTDLPGEELE